MEWRRRLALLPWWAHALVSGTMFGTAMTVWSGLQTGHWISALILGPLAGAVFGVVMGRWAARYNRSLLQGTEHVPLASVRQALRQARHGTVPAHDQARAAALTMASRQLSMLDQTHRRNVIVFASAIALDIFLVVTQSLWWLLSAAIFASFAIAAWWARRALRRQIGVLRAGSPGELVSR